MQRWRVRARQFARGVTEGIQQARAELERRDLLPSTRQRIERSVAALEDNRDRVLALLADAGIRPAATEDGELHTEERASAAGHPGIAEYYEQLHRDWAWGTEGAENKRALERIAAVLGEDRELGVVVVLGAGAGRLAYDVQLAFAPPVTVALDINPLLSLVAAKMALGETLSLYEFPLIPRDLEHTQVLRELRAPRGPARGLSVVVADAFRAPLAAATVDTVITPWFVDQVPADFREAVALAHHLLAPGGRWINHGPLIYPKHRPYATRYTPTEVFELVTHGGFEVGAHHTEMLEFLRSPASGFARLEQVLTWVANKRPLPAVANETVEVDAAIPSWLVCHHLPVPRFDGLEGYAAPHPLLGYVAQMIDGETPLRAITGRVVSEHGVTARVAAVGVPAAAEAIWRACLALRARR